MALALLTACGDSKKETSAQADADIQSTLPQMEENIPEEEDFPEDSEIEEDFANEELCAMYYDYMFGNLSEDEFSEALEFYSKSIDDVKVVFDEHGEEFGYQIYEMSDEIKNSKVCDQIMQIGDTVVNFPCTLGEFIEITGGELVSTDGLSSIDRAFEDIYLYRSAESLDTMLEGGHAMVRTPDESYLYCTLLHSKDEGLLRAEDFYIYEIITGSNNVFLSGGLHTGLSMDEIDELFSTNMLEGASHCPWGHNSSSESGREYLYIAADQHCNWEFHSGLAGLHVNIEIRTDTEGQSLYYLSAGFDIPPAE